MLPLLISDKDVAAQLGVSKRSIRTLRNQGKLRAVKVAGCWMYPRDAAETFIRENLERAESCQDETEDRASSSERTEAFGMYAGTSADGPDGKARARRIAQRLRASSRPSSAGEPGTKDRVIQPAFR